jgi:hypothetical protein
VKHLLRTWLVGVWVATAAVVGAGSVVLGAGITLGNAALWLVFCLAPPAVMLLVWRGPPPATVAELLHAVDGPSKEDK